MRAQIHPRVMRLKLQKFKNEKEPTEGYCIHRAILLAKTYDENISRTPKALESALRRTR